MKSAGGGYISVPLYIGPLPQPDFPNVTVIGVDGDGSVAEVTVVACKLADP
jgi:hypothetical protein